MKINISQRQNDKEIQNLSNESNTYDIQLTSTFTAILYQNMELFNQKLNSSNFKKKRLIILLFLIQPILQTHGLSQNAQIGILLYQLKEKIMTIN
ncbi:hypothetical protein pb186bvf_021010 [Paramecium bursaria]